MFIDLIAYFTASIALLDCLIVPFVLGNFYPNYSHRMMTLSALGGQGSPVKKIYNFWMVCLGISFMIIGIYLFQYYSKSSYFLACLLLIVTLAYAIFDCLLSSIFSVGNSKEMYTLEEKIHGYGSACGWTLFLFGGIIRSYFIGKN